MNNVCIKNASTIINESFDMKVNLPLSLFNNNIYYP